MGEGIEATAVHIYAVTALCVLIGVTCMATLNHESRVLALRQWGMAALYGSGDVSDLTLWPVDFRIGAIWFLLALFWARLLLHFFAKYSHNFRPYCCVPG